ncbi:MAG TPA: acyl-CoA dehydrogenase family protein [Tepidiformaceae bacterium]|nr:acyl-CoA dehydrogenase family protein [Tepidiformaceae bacterium]
MDWIERARELARGFSERAPDHDRAGTFPFENFEELREAGFFGLTVPRRFGGSEASLGEYLGVLEAIAYGDGSTALSFMMHLKTFGQEREARAYPPEWVERMARGAVERGELVNTVATEEGLGSPAGGGMPDTTAVRDGEGWRLSGRKTFTTLAPLLHYFIVLARVDEPGGRPRLPGGRGQGAHPGMRDNLLKRGR